MSPKRLIKSFVGLLIVSAAMTTLFLSLRALQLVGNCGSGGVYRWGAACPDGTAVAIGVLVVSIFALLMGLVLYIANRVPGGPGYTLILWSALFLSLAWNFLELGLWPPGGGGVSVGRIVAASVLGLIGALPFLRAPKQLLVEFLGDGQAAKPAAPGVPGRAGRARGESPLPAAGYPPAPASRPGAGATRPGDGLAGELTRLADLRRQGMLTDDEYRRAKDAVLRKGGAS